MENLTRYYSIELQFDGEERELYTTYPYREPKKIDPPTEEEKEKEWFKAEVQRPKDKWRFVWINLPHSSSFNMCHFAVSRSERSTK